MMLICLMIVALVLFIVALFQILSDNASVSDWLSIVLIILSITIFGISFWIKFLK